MMLRTRRALTVALLIAGIMALVVGGRALGGLALLWSALEWIRALGPWGPAAFAAIYVAATVLFVPGFVLTLGGGFVFGVAAGTAVVSVSSTLGATAAFLVGRHLARGWVTRWIAGDARFLAIDQAVAREGWKIVGLTRLSPIFPFNLLNYAFGLTRVSLRDFVLASWIGMFPATVTYVYLGSLAGDLATLGAGQRARTPAEWALYLVGLLATITVMIYVTRLARSALARRVA